MIRLVDDSIMPFMRNQAETNFPDTCVITYRTPVSDGRGGTNYIETTATSPCQLVPAGQTPAERQIAEQVAPAITWRVLFPHGANVPSTARLAITLANGSVTTLEVVAPLEHSYESALMVIARE